jgi:hypothetical protein
MVVEPPAPTSASGQRRPLATDGRGATGTDLRVWAARTARATEGRGATGTDLRVSAARTVRDGWSWSHRHRPPRLGSEDRPRRMVVEPPAPTSASGQREPLATDGRGATGTDLRVWAARGRADLARETRLGYGARNPPRTAGVWRLTRSAPASTHEVDQRFSRPPRGRSRNRARHEGAPSRRRRAMTPEPAARSSRPGCSRPPSPGAREARDEPFGDTATRAVIAAAPRRRVDASATRTVAFRCLGGRLELGAVAPTVGPAPRSWGDLILPQWAAGRHGRKRFSRSRIATGSSAISRVLVTSTRAESL